MKKIAGLSAILIGTVCISGCVTTEGGVKHTNGHRVAVSGERTNMGRAFNLNPDCTPKTIPNIRVVQQPKHGTISVVNEPIFPTAKGIYTKCNTVKVMGSVVYYRSAPGYVGSDSYMLRTSFANGHIDDDSVDVNVVK